MTLQNPKKQNKGHRPFPLQEAAAAEQNLPDAAGFLSACRSSAGISYTNIKYTETFGEVSMISFLNGRTKYPGHCQG